MKTVVLLSPWESAERRIEADAAARAGFQVAFHASQVSFGEVVVPRVSMRRYPEIFRMLRDAGAMPINSETQHGFVHDPSRWADTLGACTSRTWMDPERVVGHSAMYEVRGGHGIALHVGREGLRAAFDAAVRTCRAGDPPVVVSEKPTLYEWRASAKVMIADRWRYAIMKQEVMHSVFVQKDDIPRIGDCPIGHTEPTVARRFVQRVAALINRTANFYGVEIARKADGSWTVLTLLEGESMPIEDASSFYPTLRERLTR